MVLEEPLDGWISKEDRRQLRARLCRVLFYRGGPGRRCECADRLLRSIAGRQSDGNNTLLADSDWHLIRDPKMDDSRGALGLHYTAWSARPELRTVGDLEVRHLAALEWLREAGSRAIAAKHADVEEADLQLFTHFPPNIFRLHVHFVHRNASTWAPDHEVVFVSQLLRGLRAGVGPELKKKQELEPLRCGEWN